MNMNEQLLQCALRIEQLMRQLADKPNRCLHCRHEVSLAPPVPSLSELATKAHTFYSQPAAADFLERSEKQVYRYRVDGDLPISHDDQGCIRYAEADLEVLFEKLHGFPKGGFNR
ncbi:helix-turn-helix domain-containing protein [Parapedobacter sp. 10938]|uniref:helix-turn-helix domain-containing protein n=1 Tax=Parapedobacter flavus TaxID=3110225 RepID=UPI002DBDCC38|nr:helix-turn-helix domain-containing protein [Parapedobacter sp. 10938]MEC3879742.1 helix-turn-helix domain-containing protein [Parapedobacter sp. 10938]